MRLSRTTINAPEWVVTAIALLSLLCAYLVGAWADLPSSHNSSHQPSAGGEVYMTRPGPDGERCLLQHKGDHYKILTCLRDPV